MMHLSVESVRHVLLAVQGLSIPPTRPAVKPDVMAAIRGMALLQIDTIHIVARSPYLVLWSRLGQYDPVWLEDALAEGHLFEYWAHEACFIPVEDYPLFRYRMLNAEGHGWHYRGEWARKNRKLLAATLEHIRENGPTRSADFKRTDGRTGSWWGWKDEKIALETLFTTGKLMIARRHNFHRVYDLQERVLPDWDDSAIPVPEHISRTLALKAARALGVVTEGWLADYYRIKKNSAIPLLKSLADEGALAQATIEGVRGPAYIHPDTIPVVKSALAGRLQPTHTTLLSPFDPLVWDRRRALELFGFDYRIECYTPEAKRKYGYFTLPILHRGALVGRLDPKAHRKEGIFEIKHLHLEPGIRATDELLQDLATAISSCAAWHRTPQVVISASTPKVVAGRLRGMMGV